MINNNQPNNANQIRTEQPRPAPLAKLLALASSPQRIWSKASLELAGLWVALRLGTSLWAAIVSQWRPLTEREQAIALWPPSAPITAWLERVLLAPWERWDVKYYIWIAARGYEVGDGTTQFHPLLPWLATPLAWIGIRPLLGLMITSSLAGMLLLLSFENLAKFDLQPATARVSTLLLVFSPPAFILFAPYTESLFLLWAVLCLYWARRKNWWLAGIAGLFATLTRQQGIFLALALAWELWESSKRNWRLALSNWRDWLSIGLVPGGMLVWLVYRAIALSDLAVNLGNWHTLIYSLLISPSADKVVPGQTFMWPWQALGLALAKLASKPDIDIAINLILGMGFIVLLCIAWRSMRTSYRIYSVAIAIISFSYHTGPIHPYQGLLRHLLLAFPVFIGLGAALHRPITRLFMVACGAFGMFSLLLLYVMQTWIP